MSLEIKRILWVILGITFLFFIKVTTVVPGVHFVFAIICFKRAYDINKLLRADNPASV